MARKFKGWPLADDGVSPFDFGDAWNASTTGHKGVREALGIDQKTLLTCQRWCVKTKVVELVSLKGAGRSGRTVDERITEILEACEPFYREGAEREGIKWEVYLAKKREELLADMLEDEAAA